MPALTRQGLNFGRNCTLRVLIGGTPFYIKQLITEAQFKPLTTLHTENPINNGGMPVRDVTYEGVEVTLRISRQNGTIDDLFIALLRNYKAQGPKPVVTYTRTVRNPVGTAQRQIFTDGTIQIENLGTFQGNSTVKDVEMKVTFSDMDDVGGDPIPDLGITTNADGNPTNSSLLAAPNVLQF